MALNDLTGQNIQDTYQKVVQTDGNSLADGTGSSLPISFDGDNVTIEGTLTAQTYVVSESIINVSSGSTIFGNSSDDTHTFTGNITASSNISSSGTIYASAGDFGEGSITNVEAIHLDSIQPDDGTNITIGASDTTGTLTLHSHLTASGNISSSGNVYASNFILPPDGEITPSVNHGTIKFMTKPPGTANNGETVTIG